MNQDEQFERFAITYIEDLLDRLLVDQNKIYLIQKDKSAIIPLSPGFGMGFSGINYFLRFASVCILGKKLELSRAEGNTKVLSVYHLNRGYDRMDLQNDSHFNWSSFWVSRQSH